MATFSKIKVFNTIEETAIVPVFYNSNIEIAKQILKACYDGGIRVFEFTNRGDFAIDVFSELVKYAKRECPEMILGIGSIIDAPTAALYIQNGANFVVGPCLNTEIAKLCNRHGIPYVPGCGSITEINTAHEFGCDITKIFPAGCVGGPSFVKNIMAPMPWSLIMATGSVEPTEENLKEWIKSGVFCVGIGSQLFTKDEIADKNWTSIEKKCRFALSIVKNNRR